MSVKIGSYYLLTRPVTPIEEIDGLIFDTNLVGAIYDWFISTCPSSSDTESLVPILKLLRSKKLVHWQYGALERAWAWQKVDEVNSQNFNKVNPHLFMQIGLCIHTLLLANDHEFDLWIHPSRNFSIPFMSKQSLPYFEEQVDHYLASEFSEIIVSLWLEILILIERVKSLSGIEKVEKLKAAYTDWVETYRGLGLPRFGDVELLAYMSFFGGSIQDSHYENNYTTPRVQGRRFTAKELLKMDEWESKGIVKIARNIAFDFLFFRRQLEMYSGYKQEGEKFVSGNSEILAIVTGDKMMNAVSATVRRIYPLQGQLYPVEYRYPRDSKFCEAYPEPEAMAFFTDLRFTPPEDRPKSTDFLPLFRSTIERHRSLPPSTN
jgi:hypothetical protein